MARFDVYRPGTGEVLLLDCQADLLSSLESRFVVPLMPRGFLANPFGRLNPFFEVEGVRLVMVTQSAAAVPVRALGRHVVSLAHEQATIMNALDMLLTGY
ncbi:CcdB family protein [Sphingomonas sp. AR_OL41]|jgi:toxin CcdB|uniref:CcdB family protein n=1 Tax=Sphingomonas sp. AR_OL41 TaxID=3042729 RepID=UPI00247FC0D2|nr:CcdB family protein [Sphingomonas sp. AR_OL41]MDH7974794.1 CcdB family protein [Sphingomonas sp. AR_OL41]